MNAKLSLILLGTYLAAPRRSHRLVKRWTVWGDQDGNDAEVYTGVQVELENMRIKLETAPKEEAKTDALKAAAAMVKSQLSKTLPVLEP